MTSNLRLPTSALPEKNVVKNQKPGRPLLSVIIPALDIDLELERCIGSVRLAFGETDDRVEIVLVAPGSRIGLAKERLQGVAQFVAETRRGIYGAMNDGIRASTGRYLYFLGKDDIVLAPFSKVMDQLSENGGSAAFFDVYWGAQGIYSGKPSKWRLLTRNLCHQGIVYSREVIDKHGPYLSRMKVQADHLLNIRLLWDAQFAATVRYMPGARVWYASEGFSSVARDPVFWRLYPVILKRYVSPIASALLVISRHVRGRTI